MIELNQTMASPTKPTFDVALYLRCQLFLGTSIFVLSSLHSKNKYRSIFFYYSSCVMHRDKAAKMQPIYRPIGFQVLPT